MWAKSVSMYSVYSGWMSSTACCWDLEVLNFYVLEVEPRQMMALWDRAWPALWSQSVFEECCDAVSLWSLRNVCGPDFQHGGRRRWLNLHILVNSSFNSFLKTYKSLYTMKWSWWIWCLMKRETFPSLSALVQLSNRRGRSLQTTSSRLSPVCSVCQVWVLYIEVMFSEPRPAALTPDW